MTLELKSLRFNDDRMDGNTHYLERTTFIPCPGDDGFTLMNLLVFRQLTHINVRSLHHAVCNVFQSFFKHTLHLRQHVGRHLE